MFDKIPHTFLTVNLDGSTVSASDTSKIANDRDDKRGWSGAGGGHDLVILDLGGLRS